METNGEKLIKELDELRRKLSSLSERLDRSGVERTNGLRVHMGADCPYFTKSMDIFLKKDYQELQDMIESINNLFNLIEGK